jgi:PhoPQ-activated pathogenicity-related protein
MMPSQERVKAVRNPLGPPWNRLLVRRELNISIVLAALAFGFLFGDAVRPVRADLDEYIKAPDAAFSWTQTGETTTPLGKVVSLDLTSQVWQGITWKHRLRIYEPTKITYPDAVLLFITGGSHDSQASEKDHLAGFELARLCGSRVAVLPQVPNQPLLGDKKEDTLIAETFIRYLDTKDENWPLLFPMVKSAVRAMDAVQAWASQQGRPELKRFVATGASKRGWTTWLTGAVDDRVVAIAPMVIVMLNLGEQGPNQLKVWGKYSEQIEDYVNRGLMETVKTEFGSRLWKMVDPYSFRDRLSKPKMLINGANDRYWTLNALDLYWDGLKGPKYLVELPNAGHGLDQNRDWALNGLGAFFRHQISGRPMPNLSWNARSGETLTLELRTSTPPRSARLWHAFSDSRDFRESNWTSRQLFEAGSEPADSEFQIELKAPDGRNGAYFADVEYEIDGIPYHLTTSFVESNTEAVNVVPAASSRHPEPVGAGRSSR